MTTRTTRHRLGLLAASTATLAMLAAAGGCNDATSGALLGAGVGALAGMGLGSLSGDMGKGAAAGAIIGGVGGGLIGDQNRREDERFYHRRHRPHDDYGYGYNQYPD